MTGIHLPARLLSLSSSECYQPGWSWNPNTQFFPGR